MIDVRFWHKADIACGLNLCFLEVKRAIGSARIAWPVETHKIPNQMLAETYLTTLPLGVHFEAHIQPEIWLGQCVSHYVFAVHFLPIIRKRLDMDPSGYQTSSSGIGSLNVSANHDCTIGARASMIACRPGGAR